LLALIMVRLWLLLVVFFAQNSKSPKSSAWIFCRKTQQPICYVFYGRDLFDSIKPILSPAWISIHKFNYLHLLESEYTSAFIVCTLQDCQIFLGTTYQKRGKYTTMATKYQKGDNIPKLPQNIPNGHW
jgi:hypothetical protein